MGDGAITILLSIIYLILSVSGVTLFKLGISLPSAISVGGGYFSFQISVRILIGLCCYVCSFILYMFLIAKHDISFLVPVLMGLLYVMTMLASVIFLKEKVTMLHAAGSLLILAGLCLITLKR